jgi:hypothetical protein
MRLAALVYVALALVVTWPLGAQLATGVSDFGDPLLNSWILAWIAHTLPTSPAALLDGNVFYPEQGTLAYSELLLLPALMVAPLNWLGGTPILAHNVLLLSGYVLSGLTMFALTRRLTGHQGAALVAGAIFAVYPFRIDQFAHVQLQLVWWWPLAMLLLHELMESPTRGRALSLGAALAANVYTCVYWAIYGGVVFASIATVLLVARRPSWTVWRAAASAALVAIVLSLPAARAYSSASRTVGERPIEVNASGSAAPADYLSASPENALYGHDRRPGRHERHLFPGYTTPVLALGALTAPAAVPVAFAVGTLVAVDLSFGLNAPGYATLFRWLPPFRALRMPVRFAMFTGLCLAVLASFTVARLCTGRSRVVQWTIVVALLTTVTLESRMRPVALSELPELRPAVYEWLAHEPGAIVAEYPLGDLEGRAGPQDATYMYYSTLHWKPIVNGYSGFVPPSWGAMRDALVDFPDDRSIAALRTRGVTHLLVHSVFYIRGDYAADLAALQARRDLELAGRFRWKNGGESAAFRLR